MSERLDTKPISIKELQRRRRVRKIKELVRRALRGLRIFGPVGLRTGKKLDSITPLRSPWRD